MEGSDEPTRVKQHRLYGKGHRDRESAHSTPKLNLKDSADDTDMAGNRFSTCADGDRRNLMDRGGG